MNRINLSIDLNALGDAVRNKHSSVTTSQKNGKKYANVTIWINENPDQFGNDASMQLNSAKDVQEQKVFIGNGKTNKTPPPQPQPHSTEYDEDLPF